MLLALVSLLLLTGSPVADAKERPWIELQSRNFLVVSNEEPEEAVALLRNLELFRSVVLKITNTQVYEARVPTVVYLFRARKSFAPFRPSRNVAGYVIPTDHGNYIAIDGGSKALERPVELLAHQALGDRGRFAAGQDQRVDPVQVLLLQAPNTSRSIREPGAPRRVLILSSEQSHLRTRPTVRNTNGKDSGSNLRGEIGGLR